MAPRETENNAYANFWGDKQRALWYVMVFSGVVNSICSQKLLNDIADEHTIIYRQLFAGRRSTTR